MSRGVGTTYRFVGSMQPEYIKHVITVSCKVSGMAAPEVPEVKFDMEGWIGEALEYK